MKKTLLSGLLFLALLGQTAFASPFPTEKNIKIAIIDTGISTGAIESERLAPGYNYLEENSDTEDQIGHGTAVAGLLVGAPSVHLTGIVPQAKLVPLVYQTKDEKGKVQKGDQEVIARAIRDAVDLYGCRIINLSVGTTLGSTLMREAVNYAEEKNAVVISSVGNSNGENPGVLYYPAAYPTVIGVGSVNKRGQVSDFSQRNESVMLVAAGEKIWTVSKDGKSLLTNGTSFATAFVSGAAASLLSNHPELTTAEVRHILYGSAADIQTTGYDPVSGWGILQMDSALDWAAEGRRFRDFSPDSPMTRAMLWTMLWRIEGNTASGNAKSWYSDAQKWAQLRNISDGTNPESQITREHLAVILWRYAGLTVSAADLSGFSDTGNINDYASSAMRWAVENKILGGMGDGTLNPQGKTTRAQAAAILERCLEDVTARI